jgi:hypothetical protein
MTKRKPPEEHKRPGPKPKTPEPTAILPAIQRQQVQVKIGRPPALVLSPELVKQIEIFGRAQMSLSEAAGILGCARNTFGIFLKNNPDAMEAWETSPHAGKGQVKLAQYKAAMKGSIDALKWWGKQHLGQAEKQDSNNTGGPTTAIQINNAGPLSDDDHARIAAQVADLMG